MEVSDESYKRIQVSSYSDLNNRCKRNSESSEQQSSFSESSEDVSKSSKILNPPTPTNDFGFLWNVVKGDCMLIILFIFICILFLAVFEVLTLTSYCYFYESTICELFTS